MKTLKTAAMGIFVALGLVGCNTFGDTPELGAGTADAGVDSGMSTGDSGDVGGDAGEPAQPIWTITEAPRPEISPREISENLESCLEPVLIEEELRRPEDFDLFAVGGPDERRFATVAVNDSDRIVVNEIDLDGNLSNVWTSPFGLAQTSSQVVAADTIGTTLMLAAIELTSSRIHLIQCTFEGESACRTIEQMHDATTVDVAARRDSFELFWVPVDTPGLVMSAGIIVQDDDPVVSLGEPLQALDVADDDILFFDTEQIAAGRQAAIMVVDTSAGEFHRVARNFTEGWLLDPEIESARASSAASPRGRLLHATDRGFIVTGETVPNIERQVIEFDGSEWAAVDADEVLDFDVSPIEGGYILGESSLDGPTLRVEASDEFYQSPIITAEGAPFVADRPLRVNVAQSVPALAFRDGDGDIVLTILCGG